jgi:hypothetical protein
MRIRKSTWWSRTSSRRVPVTSWLDGCSHTMLPSIVTEGLVLTDPVRRTSSLGVAPNWRMYCSTLLPGSASKERKHGTVYYGTLPGCITTSQRQGSPPICAQLRTIRNLSTGRKNEKTAERCGHWQPSAAPQRCHKVHNLHSIQPRTAGTQQDQARHTSGKETSLAC